MLQLFAYRIRESDRSVPPCSSYLSLVSGSHAVSRICAALRRVVCRAGVNSQMDSLDQGPKTDWFVASSSWNMNLVRIFVTMDAQLWSHPKVCDVVWLPLHDHIDVEEFGCGLPGA